ncbi:MAG: ASCH domain-containing protein [Lachnospiraceae bacterium]|nr:ASCH domain-containing protein [Lachnospiraceae bacterium]
MTAEELWQQSGLTGEYDAWSFGDDADELAELVKNGVKTATCSAYGFYELEGEELPQIGECSVILDGQDEAVCIIKTTKVYVTAYDEVTEEHAFREGEGDRSLEYWRKVHKEFFTEELQEIGQEFDEKMKVVCEEFEVVWRNTSGRSNHIEK